MIDLDSDGPNDFDWHYHSFGVVAAFNVADGAHMAAVPGENLQGRTGLSEVGSAGGRHAMSRRPVAGSSSFGRCPAAWRASAARLLLEWLNL